MTACYMVMTMMMGGGGYLSRVRHSQCMKWSETGDGKAKIQRPLLRPRRFKWRLARGLPEPCDGRSCRNIRANPSVQSLCGLEITERYRSVVVRITLRYSCMGISKQYVITIIVMYMPMLPVGGLA